MMLKAVYLTELPQCFKEIIAAYSHLILEIANPKYLRSFAGLQLMENLRLQLIVKNILEINLLNIISPWMECR